MAITIKISGICDFFAVSDSPKIPDTVNPQHNFIKLNFQLLTMPTFKRPLAHGFPSDLDPSLRNRPTKVRKTSPEQQLANDIIRKVSVASTIYALETQNAEMSIAFETQNRLVNDLRFENEQLAIDKDSIRLLAEETLRDQRLKFEAQILDDDNQFVAYKRKQQLKLKGLRRKLEAAEKQLADLKDDSSSSSDNEWSPMDGIPLACTSLRLDANLFCREAFRRNPILDEGYGVGQQQEHCHEFNVFEIQCPHCDYDQTVICSTCYESIHGYPTCDNCDRQYSAPIADAITNPL